MFVDCFCWEWLSEKRKYSEYSRNLLIMGLVQDRRLGEFVEQDILKYLRLDKTFSNVDEKIWINYDYSLWRNSKRMRGIIDKQENDILGILINIDKEESNIKKITHREILERVRTR